MADNIPFKPSGGGSFVPYTGISVTSTPSGVSGDVYDITPATGNTLRILRLSTGNTSVELGMTVTITNNNGTQDLITNDELEENQPTNGFFIGQLGPLNLDVVQKSLPFVDCQRIVVTKVAGNTAQPIDISYVEGRFE
ncbi:MAG: hypothetical protein GY920_21135 [Aliivibrio sp.]|nr:hypothetical protein [Aliivibrio sp.]MCP4323345.1 hypothetical protein [Alteromonadales bacterium]